MRDCEILKICFLLACLLQCVSARLAFMPKFYGQDSAVIVDTDKTLPARLNPKLQNALYYNIPVYKLIKPAGFSPTIPTTTTTTAVPTPSEEYPEDLLYMARNKLGLKRLELPSLSELGELLGTGSATETVKYIRTMTSNEQGIALMKAYLQTLDYGQSDTDADGDADVTDNEDEAIDGEDDNNDDNSTDNANLDTDYDNLPVKQPSTKTTTTTTTTTVKPSTEGSFMQRMGDFMRNYNLWSEDSMQEASTTSSTPVPFKPVFVVPPLSAKAPVGVPLMRPLLMRRPLPYHYPIPIRPLLRSQTVHKPVELSTTTSAPASTSTTVRTTTEEPSPIHMTSLKPSEREDKDIVAVSTAPVAPHIQQLARMANVSPQILDRFLQQQPKLAELAKHVSRLPLAQEHSQVIDSQLFMAVQRALSQDEELKHLLKAAPTLV
ncbi:uncharacterized protein LOC115634589 [Scaptodrosophila lebanonensis]|uniref:Uncharacterized protein LOC115634589 n=1 Tax=Drosophila lebanonensis TaxID=7225 RepID=A0A6J2ULG9_DROLE|nr:uncharacterized protein LOC115634589 [Scaptodrosophila lebanonensis]